MTDWLLVLLILLAAGVVAGALAVETRRLLVHAKGGDERDSAEFADWYVATHGRPHAKGGDDSQQAQI
jgi:hypothetical protein